MNPLTAMAARRVALREKPRPKRPKGTWWLDLRITWAASRGRRTLCPWFELSQEKILSLEARGFQVEPRYDGTTTDHVITW